tara:strand:- start:22 stop:729 length:708 start_codon:yes stop_codon:yes gene_type:complete
MGKSVTLEPAGDWNLEIKGSLTNALYVSIAILGRTGEEACRHALILMAQSARKLTVKSRKNRRVQRDPTFKGENRFVEVYRKGSAAPSRLFKFRFDGNSGASIPGTWDKAKLIGNAGLAKRSWFWGLSTLKGKGKRHGARINSVSKSIAGMTQAKPIAGVATVSKISTRNTGGYILDNSLGYITDALPAGWEGTIERRAGNRIMAMAKKRMERDCARAIRRRVRGVRTDLSSWFK